MRTLQHYVNRYAGRQWVIVGKGPTMLRPETLADVTGPVVFLNEAVQWSRYAVRAVERFWFAHDVGMMPLARNSDVRRCTPVLLGKPEKSRMGEKPLLSWEGLREAGITPPAEAVAYQGEWWPVDDLPGERDRFGVAARGALWFAAGTVHSAISFAWLAGASGIVFVGCDGRPGGYDDRLDTRQSQPATDATYAKIRRLQDEACKAWRIKTTYLYATRVPPEQSPVPPQIHVVWMPPEKDRGVGKQVMRRLSRLRIAAARHDIDVHVWHNPVKESGTPPAVLRRMADLPLRCQQVDLWRLWLLYRYGGIYMDVDMRPVGDLSLLRRWPLAAARQSDGRVNNAVIAAEPGHPALAAVLDAALKEPLEARASLGPNLLTRFAETEDPWTLWAEWLVYPFQSAGVLASCSDVEAYLAKFPQRPVLLHEWGIGGSGRMPSFGRGDAWLYRLGARFGRSPLRLAEVGVLAGRLSQYILARGIIEKYYMVDVWRVPPPDSRYARSGDAVAEMSESQMRKTREDALAQARKFKPWTAVLEKPSVEAAKDVPDGSLDSVFIDADHTFEGTLEDLRAWAPKVRPGGLLAGHDWESPADPGWPDNPRWGVRQAVEAFLAEQGWPADGIELGGETTWFYQVPWR